MNDTVFYQNRDPHWSKHRYRVYKPVKIQYHRQNVRQKQSENQILVGILRSKLFTEATPKKLHRNSGSWCKKTYRNIVKTGKIVLEPLKYIDFAYVNVDFTVEKFYWRLISQKIILDLDSPYKKTYVYI